MPEAGHLCTLQQLGVTPRGWASYCRWHFLRRTAAWRTTRATRPCTGLLTMVRLSRGKGGLSCGETCWRGLQWRGKWSLFVVSICFCTLQFRGQGNSSGTPRDFAVHLLQVTRSQDEILVLFMSLLKLISVRPGMLLWALGARDHVNRWIFWTDYSKLDHLNSLLNIRIKILSIDIWAVDIMQHTWHPVKKRSFFPFFLINANISPDLSCCCSEIKKSSDLSPKSFYTHHVQLWI